MFRAFPSRLLDISRGGDRSTSYVSGCFENLYDPPPARSADVRVDLRGRDRLVTQKIANVPDVRAALEQLGRIAMPEHLRMHVDAGPP